MGKLSIGPKQSLEKTQAAVKTEVASIETSIETKTVEVVKYVEVPVQVIKEVPVEVIKEVEKVVEVPVEKIITVIKEVPVEVNKEVEKLVEVIKEVPVFLDRIKVQTKVPSHMWLIIGVQLALNIALLAHLLK